jgi:hypothetical protein
MVGLLGLLCQYKRFLSCHALAALYFFFFTLHYFNSFVPIVQQAGQAVVLGRLSLNMCLWSRLFKSLKRATKKQHRH